MRMTDKQWNQFAIAHGLDAKTGKKDAKQTKPTQPQGKMTLSERVENFMHWWLEQSRKPPNPIDPKNVATVVIGIFILVFSLSWGYLGFVAAGILP